jgi:hypothetical protein
MFKNVKAIILETGDNFLIGRVTELQVFDGKIYILDEHVAKALFVFDLNGKFIRKIGNIGKGPGEYIRITDFTIDTENRFIYLLDRGNRVHKYELNGRYVNTVSIQISNVNTHYIQYYDKKLYSEVCGYTPTRGDYLLLEINPQDGKVITRSLPKKYNKGWNETVYANHSFFISRLNNPPKYTQFFMNYIVSIGSEIRPYIELKSENLVTSKDILQLRGEPWQKYDSFHKSSKVYDIHSLVESDVFIFFHYWHGSTTCGVLFNKQDQSVEIANIIYDDILYKNDELVQIFKFSDSRGAYSLPDEYWLSEFQEKIKKNKFTTNLDNLDQLMSLSEDSNPVILYYEFK